MNNIYVRCFKTKINRIVSLTIILFFSFLNNYNALASTLVKNIEHSKGAYIESKGIVSIETEDAIENTTYAFIKSKSNHKWISVPGLSNKAMKCSPETNSSWVNINKISAVSPSLSYKIKFSNSGSYNLWVLLKPSSKCEGSIHIGLDSKYKFSKRILMPNGKFIWRNVGLLKNISSSYHTLNIFAYKDGIVIDKLFLTQSQVSPKNAGPITSARENVSSQITNLSNADQIAPSAPSRLTILKTTSTSATLIWNSSEDNVGIKEYIIYRNNIPIAATSSTNYIDKSKLPSVINEYTIKAEDDANNLSSPSNTVSNKFLILVASPLYKDISIKLNTYITDINRIEGWCSSVIKINNKDDGIADYICNTPEDLKKVIKAKYYDGYQGFVIIGSDPSIPTAYVKYCPNFVGNRQIDTDSNPIYPSDLYYEDIDDWTVKDSDNVYVICNDNTTNNGQPVSNEFTPEMFSGRISGKSITGNNCKYKDEASAINEYLNKIHNYRLNGSNLSEAEANRSLLFADDGLYNRSLVNNNQILYKETHCFFDYSITNSETLTHELEKGYAFANILIHASNDFFQMQEWTHGKKLYKSFSIENLKSINPKINYLDLCSCSALKYQSLEVDSLGYAKKDSSNCFIKKDLANIGATFLFNNDYTYNVLGSTANWGCQPEQSYYEDLGNSVPIGLALRLHKDWALNCNKDYGISKALLLGDPLMHYKKNNTSNNPISINNLNEHNFIQASVGTNLRLPIYNSNQIDNNSISVSFSGLPSNAIYDSNTKCILWTPSIEDLDKYYIALINLKDPYGNIYVEEFTIYVSYFKNSLLTEQVNGKIKDWDMSGSMNIASKLSFSPINDSICSLSVNNNFGFLKQTIAVKPNTTYLLSFWVKNDLTQNADETGIYIKNLDINVKCKKFDNNYTYKEVCFNSLDNSSIDVFINIGSKDLLCSGDIYYTGFNLIPLSLGFEEVENNLPLGWNNVYYCYADSAEFSVDNVIKHSGNYSAKITTNNPSINGSIAYYTLFMNVKPNTNYHLSCFIKTKDVINLSGGQIGANINYMDYYSVSQPNLLGTNDWTPVDLYFNSGTKSSVEIRCSLGHLWNYCKGTVWFDDIKLEKVQ